MEFLMFVPLNELELHVIESNGIEITDWYYNLDELFAHHVADCEYSILLYDDFISISNN